MLYDKFNQLSNSSTIALSLDKSINDLQKQKQKLQELNDSLITLHEKPHDLTGCELANIMWALTNAYSRYLN